MQSPLLSAPLKQTNEIDWITPLKSYIRQHYGDDPERYAEECATLNRLRQDMRGAGKDSAAGRDLLYRYYGQLELLDLRFPVDENHIRISFTWFDAFTHKPTAQHSLAYEKASIIFNIAAVLSNHAAHQNRHEDTGLKTAYHSFQASAGMFTYINENFLHAPSSDLNHDTVRTLIGLTLAQAQEVFLEKQIADSKKVGLLAKLASQAAYLYSQAVEGVQDNVTKAIFEKVWLLLTQVKSSYMGAVAQYYQALADDDANSHGVAIARLQSAERQAKEANRIANTFPTSLPANSNLSSDTGAILLDLTKRHLSTVQEKITELNKDNDFIYHQTVPNEASLSAVPKLPAAKAISVSELYQGQDIHRIIGPDIFQRIVPMSVTESASLYDEEKAKMIRAEAERVETANGEMAASLDYLKLPSSLNVLKGGMDQEPSVDEEFRRWCEELAGHSPFEEAFEKLADDKSQIMQVLSSATAQLDMEESVCEKMRSKYGGEWTQQPSSRLTTTLRSDIKNYQAAIDEASSSDAQLQSTFRQYQDDFDEMRSAGEAEEADVLYQRAMIKAGAGKGKSVSSPAATEGNLLDEEFEDGSASVAEQITSVEDLLKKLNLIKKERQQTLQDLKDKVHNDDISQVLILNKKSVTSQENQLFKSELEKFRPYQTRILQANHKQASLMKELTKTYNTLLQDKRVRSEQSKYETFSRQRGVVMNKYRKVWQAFRDLQTGLERAQGFYSEMKDTVESLSQNVVSFVGNRKSEGGELLAKIEKGKANGTADRAAQERDRLTDLMERMNMSSSRPGQQQPSYQSRRPEPLQNIPPYHAQYNPATSPPLSGQQQPLSGPLSGGRNNTISPGYISPSSTYAQQGYVQQASAYRQPYDSQSPYNPNFFGPVSPPPGQQRHSQRPSVSSPGQQNQYGQPGYVPPPPPPGPPPNQEPDQYTQGGYGTARGNGYAGDPWAGLSGWK